MNRKQHHIAHQPFILIVDDEPKNLQVLGTILSRQRYYFTPATSGAQALKIVEKKLPDLILLDIMMPDMDGYEVCSILKKAPRTKDIPIIFLTAKTETEHIVKGFEMGAVDYVTKPFTPEELLARIKTHLEMIKISNERKELLHILSHDLANTYNPIISGLKMINDYKTFERMKQSFHTAADNGMRIIRLVREMRALEENKKRLPLDVFPLIEAVNESELLLQRICLEKNIEFVVDMDESLTVYVEYTSFVNSVINNLLTNAIKFSFPGSKILITANAAGEQVVISIRDFGIGISEALIKDLFNMRKTTSRIGTSGETGTGFGMPLVKKFIEIYGGLIEVFSREKTDDEIDHGTEIRLTLERVKPS